MLSWHLRASQGPKGPATTSALSRSSPNLGGKGSLLKLVPQYINHVFRFWIGYLTSVFPDLSISLLNHRARLLIKVSYYFPASKFSRFTWESYYNRHTTAPNPPVFTQCPTWDASLSLPPVMYSYRHSPSSSLPPSRPLHAAGFVWPCGRPCLGELTVSTKNLLSWWH